MSECSKNSDEGALAVLSNYWCRNRGWHVKVSMLEQRPFHTCPGWTVTACHIRGASEARSWDFPDPAAVLGSPSMYHRTPLLPLCLLASSFPGLPPNPIRLLPWHPLGMMFPHLWLLLWPPPLSLQALSQCRWNGILWPLVAHAGALHCLPIRIQ